MFKKSISILLTTAMMLLSGAVASFAAQDGLSLDGIYGNVLENGTFENGIDTWIAPEGASISPEYVNTYDNSAASAVITQPAGGETFVYTQTQLRNNTYYKVQAQIKLANNTSSAAASIVAAVTNTDSVAVLETEGEAVSSNEWTTVEGYFFNTVTGTAGTNTGSDPEAEYFMRDTNIYVKIDGSAQVTYYLDNIILTKIEGSLNPHFQEINGSNLFGYQGGSVTMQPFDADAEGVRELVDAGEFPDVTEVAAVSGGSAPVLRVALDKGVDYELTIWFKITDGMDSGSLVLFVQNLYQGCKSQFNTARTYKITKANEGWQRLTMTLSYPSNANSAVGDALIVLKVMEGNNIYSGSTAGRSLELAELYVKPCSDAIQHSHFASVKTNQWGGNDSKTLDGGVNFNDYSTNSAPYTLQNATMKVLMNDETDAMGTYDGSKMTGALTLTADRAVVGQTISFERNAYYNFSVWAKLGEDVTAEEVTGALRVENAGGRGSDYTTVTLQKDRWVRIAADNKKISLTSGKVALKITGATEGTVYFSGLSAVKLPASAEIPAISSVTAPEKVVAGRTFDAPVAETDFADTYSLRYRYYIADTPDSAEWIAVGGGHTLTGGGMRGILAQLDWVGKYLKTTVTPVNRDGSFGEEAVSSVVPISGILKAVDNSPAEIRPGEAYAASVTVENTSGEALPILFVIAHFDENDVLTELKSQYQSIAVGMNHTFTPEITAPSASGTIRMYFCESGADATSAMTLCPVAEVIQK